MSQAKSARTRVPKTPDASPPPPVSSSAANKPPTPAAKPAASPAAPPAPAPAQSSSISSFFSGLFKSEPKHINAPSTRPRPGEDKTYGSVDEEPARPSQARFGVRPPTDSPRTFKKEEKEIERRNSEPEVDFDKTLQFNNWCLDVIFFLRNDTSLNFTFITVDSRHPFSRKMRFLKLVNVVFLNMLLAALVTTFLLARCADCSNRDCVSCLRSTNCNWCNSNTDNRRGCFDVNNPQYWFVGPIPGTSDYCVNTNIVTAAGLCDISGPTSAPSPAGARDSCESGVKKTDAKVVAITIAAGLFSAIYSVIVEQVLTCYCFLKCCRKAGSVGRSAVQVAQGMGNWFVSFMVFLSLLFAVAGISLIAGNNKDVSLWLYTWFISFISAEAQGIGISLLLFSFLYRREKSAAQAAAAMNAENANNKV
eukprot:TRINITY_DN891_c0_g1_i1.p1 TRINITY_DN891_c0_g1~~TRINITY_DN891_c0_g1_i1.p1  ORF type:complete len:421 (+),score=129.04 TRINITY_DN891_c0_g1_i1:91-1353(+)